RGGHRERAVQHAGRLPAGRGDHRPGHLPRRDLLRDRRDSASIVMGMLSQDGEEDPSRWLIVFWGVATGAVAGVLRWAGGLEALQTGVIIVATPFVLVLVAMCVSLWRELRQEEFVSTLSPPLRLHITEHEAER